MINLFFASLLSFLLVIFPAICTAQSSLTDTAFLSKARAHAYEVYTNKIAEQSPLVNGSEYKEYFTIASLTTGIPYFMSDDWIDGTVSYDSGVYTNVPMLYDEVTDKLVIEQPFSHFKLELISEKVGFFQMSGHTFVRIVRAKSDSTINTGFYDLLYDGKTKAYMKRSKQVFESAQVGGVTTEYLDHDRYLILKDGSYHLVNKKASVMKLFSDKKRSLRKLMRANKSRIDFQRHRETSVALIAKLYDESEP